MDVTKDSPRARPLWRRGLDRWRGWRCARALLPSSDPEPTLADPVSQAVTAGQCADPIYARWCEVIRERPRLHRKQWEFVYLLRALEANGMLEEGRRGLGFGVGREPLVAALAAAGCRILATDLPPEHPDTERWRANGEYGGAKAALNERGICPPELFSERVAFAHADMRRPTELPEVERAFDFVWSSCALEHLGSLEAGLDFVRRSLAQVKPGGLAVHTTELNVTSDGETVGEGPVVLYRRRDLRALADELRAAGHAIELDFHTGATPADRHVDVPPYDEARHLKLLYGRFATTSYGLLIRRGG